jgi:hypothetical protein
VSRESIDGSVGEKHIRGSRITGEAITMFSRRLAIWGVGALSGLALTVGSAAPAVAHDARVSGPAGAV